MREREREREEENSRNKEYCYLGIDTSSIVKNNTPLISLSTDIILAMIDVVPSKIVMQAIKI